MSGPFLELLRPEALWLLLLVIPLVFFLARDSHTGMDARRKTWVVALRMLLFLCLVLALSRPVFYRDLQEQVVVVLEDVSDSMGGNGRSVAADLVRDLKLLLPQPTGVKHVRFGRTALLADGDEPEGTETDLASGLRLAGGLIPEGVQGSVLLVSDGGATRGKPARVAMDLALRGIPVHTRALEGPLEDDAFPGRAVLPDPWWPGGVEIVSAVLHASRAGTGTLEVHLDGKEVTGKSLSLVPGKENRVTIPVRVEEPGAHLLEFTWQADWDQVAGNDRLRVPFAVQEPFKVVWVRDASGNPESLLEGAGFSVRRRAPGNLESLLAEGNVPDLVVLDDVPADSVGDDGLSLLAERVMNCGTGLVLAGARSSFGPGGYAGSPLEPILPVLLEQREERRDPSVALALIIDTSGSMGNRVDLAKEVARLSLSRLKPHDRIGIVEFYGHKRWATPLQPASNQIDILRALNRLQAGGGTVLMPAIEEAYYGLMNVTTRFKHVLILTDAGVERGPFEPLVRRMSEQGITCSTVLVGPGRDSEFLLNLARWGRGRYYQAPGRFQLPEIILKQPTSSILPPFISGPLRVSPRADVPDLDGLDFSSAPALAGAVETRPRDGAQVLLQVGDEAPLLARWRYGLGRVACWMTETQGSMLGAWPSWDGYGKLMRRVLREAARRNGRPWLEAKAEQEANRIVVTARAGDLNGRPLMPAVLTLSQDNLELGEVEAYAPGMFHLECPADAIASDRGPLRARVMESSGERLVRLLAVPDVVFRAERALMGKDEDMLAALRIPGGGLADPAPADLAVGRMAQDGRSLPRVLSPWLLLLAVFLYLLEILSRRWPGKGIPSSLRRNQP